MPCEVSAGMGDAPAQRVYGGYVSPVVLTIKILHRYKYQQLDKQTTQFTLHKYQQMYKYNLLSKCER
jgi:hypothetical protein